MKTENLYLDLAKWRYFCDFDFGRAVEVERLEGDTESIKERYWRK